MPICKLDHLVVAAKTLEQGVSYIEGQLGVTVPAGGAHPLMGTHNRLMRLGAGVFLEIIAIDPQASQPERPRWYALDDSDMQDRIASRPALITWVVRADDISAAAGSSTIPPGPVIEGRRGDLVWQISVPDDGSMPEGGLFPTLIEWPGKLNEFRTRPQNGRPGLFPEEADRVLQRTAAHEGRPALDRSGRIGRRRRGNGEA